ncbi:hypothetical protein PT7_1512 [Pusillimonas sp. T7-7]|uniref:hypothetical protein n=1 Tax=Pusillimonas sp. (strain T7-7) TaxID=1007105 RepID=UPI0002084DDD|nr:hypothetical protein [Pusillimonas sp. T7-7]AEC20052.1 hypothetical protein PT7_1512 [Pusillimonas sp. T7-7]
MNQLLVPLLVVTAATLGAGVLFLLLLLAAAGTQPTQRRAWKAWLHRLFCRMFFDCFGRGDGGVGHSKG